MKALSRNSVTSIALGREGVLNTITTNIINSLATKKYCPKLKVALEAVVVLTKASKNATY